MGQAFLRCEKKSDSCLSMARFIIRKHSCRQPAGFWESFASFRHCVWSVLAKRATHIKGLFWPDRWSLSQLSSVCLWSDMKKCVFVVIRQQSTEGQRSPQLKLKRVLAVPSQLLIAAEHIALHLFVLPRGTFLLLKGSSFIAWENYGRS